MARTAGEKPAPGRASRAKEDHGGRPRGIPGLAGQDESLAGRAKSTRKGFGTAGPLRGPPKSKRKRDKKFFALLSTTPSSIEKEDGPLLREHRTNKDCVKFPSFTESFLHLYNLLTF